MKHSPRSWSKARQKPSRSMRLVLEPRMVFDGSVANVIDAQAAADPAPDAGSDASLPVEPQAAESQTLPDTSPAFSLADAQTEALRLISEFLQQPDAQNQLFTLFGGQQDVASQEWLDTAQSLSQDIVEGRYSVRVETIGNAQIGGIFAAYSGQGPSGEATIFINQDWLDRSPSRETVSRVLIEELGHSLDHALNGSRDTAGDEGEAFAASVLHSDLSDADRVRIAVEDDHSTVYLDGQAYEVENAALTFSAVYKGTPSSWSQEAQRIQNVATVTGSNFKFTSLDPNAPYFSGNNVSGTLTYTDSLGASQSVDGVISRLFKTGNTVEGLFFYAWGNTTTIGDGATDAAETSYILCIDPSKFTDGHSYYSTSSDPVDTKMNALIVPNSAPVANNDTATVSEDSSVTGNVLTNDSDVNLDSLAVSAFTVAGSAGPFVVGTPYAISGVGSLTLNSNGSFTFTPAANYAGPVPLITYTASDGSATSTATLSIGITPVNDAPTGTDDSVTTTKDTPVILGISDFGSYSDIENSPLAKIQITTLESKGTLEYFNGSSWVDVPLNHEITAADINAGKLRYTPASGESGASYTTIGFKVSDGSAYSAGAYTLTVNVNAGNANPAANADTAPDAVEAGYNIAGTNPAGNVLSNDSDADTAITAGTTHKVTLAGNASANTSGAVADGTTSSSSPAGIAGLYGTLKIGADGSYIYEVDNSNATVQALRTTSNTLTETFTYTMADASGATASSTLTVVIKGSNDAPVAVNDYDTLQETALSGGYYGTTSGNVLPNDTDVDAGDSKTVSGSYASATGSSVGTTTITLTGSGLNSISAGDYVYWDNNGAKTLLTVNNGTAVKVATSSNGTITLDNPTALSSNDQGHVFVNSDIIGFNGSYPISGNYKTATYSSTSAPSATSISLSNISEAISIGMSVTNGTDTRTVTGVTYDGSGNITQITVNTAVAWSAANLTFSAPASTTLTGRYGTLTLNSTGSYTYNLTSNVLNNGQSFTEQFSYRLSDTGGATDDAILYITVSGTTTTALADDSVTVAEDSGAYISGASNLLSNDTNATSITGFSWNGQTANAGNSITVSGIGVLTVNSDGTFSFNPEDNYTGTVPSVTYTATDGTYAASATLSISITPVNDAPTATDDTVTTLEDTTVILALSDFGAYSDIENTALATIKITTLETSGSLEYNNGSSWVPVTQDQEISVADISAGKLRFVPAADANGSPYTTVGFKVSDGTDYSTSAYTLTVNVTPVNDAPINTVPGAQTLSDYQTLTFTSGLSVADIDDTSLTVNLSVANGTLSTTLDNQNGTGVQSGSGTTSSPLVLTGTKAEINAMLASLVYTPNGGFSGSDTLRMVTTDAGGLTDTDYVAITVNADNRALTVSSPTVNEASPYAVFSVGGATGQKVLLALDVTGTGTGYAVSGSDFLPSLEYFNGTSWTAYTGAPVAIPAGGTVLLVRTPILQDTVNEGSETFKLIATNTAGVANATGGIATIRDDGQGDIYPDNTTGATDNGATKDDDRPLAVNNITVNEASPYAVFEVTGVAGQKVASLALVDGTAQGGSDYGTSFEYFNSGTGLWTAYSPSITLDGTGKLLVRTTINNDTVTPVYEGAETFGLVASNVGGRSFSGTAVILDDGTGDIYPDNTTGTKDPSPTGLDYDSAVSVTAFGPVNEGSTFAMFTVTGTAGVPLELSLNNRSTALELDSAQNNYAKIEYSYDGSSWTTYTWDGTTGDKPTAPGSSGNGTFYVRVTIAGETDTIHEGAETFDLIATTIATGTTLTQSAYATSTIIDNGTGSKYDGTITSGTPTTTSTGLDNDTPTLTVSSPTVAESDGYAVFTVSIDHASTTNISFTPSLSSSTATLATDTAAANTLEVSTNGGTSWSTVSGAVSIAAGQTSVQLRLAITDDTAVESSETFTLSTGTITGTLTSNTAVIGTATITDNDSPSNHTPVAQNDTGSTAEDTTLTVSAANGLITSTLVSGGVDSDADVGDSLSITQFTVAGDATVYTAGQTATITGKGSLTINSNGSYVFTPAANYNGSVPVATYTLSDGTATTTATLTLTVTAVNDAPLAKANSYTATEDTLLTGKNIITDNDATAGTDSDIETAAASLTIAKVNGTAWAGLTGGTDAGHLAADGWKQVSLTNGTLFIKQDGSTEYKPALNSTTGDSFTYTVTDGTDESASATVSFGVTAVNDAPLAKANSYTATEDTLLSGKNIITDNDATAGTDSDVETAAASLTIAKVNGTAWAGLTDSTDAGHLAADGWKQVALTNGTLFIKQDGSTEYKPALNSTAGDSFTYTVSDGTDESASATVSFSVTAVNDAPLAKANSYTATEDTLLTGKNIITDNDGTAGTDSDVETAAASLTIAKVNGTAWAGLTGGTDAGHLAADGWKQVSLTNGTLFIKQDGSTEYKPALNSTTGDSFTYTVTDGTDESASATVSFGVTAVNDVPLAKNNSYTATEDTLLSGKNIITDTDGTAGTDSDVETAAASLTIAKVNGTAWASLTGGTDADHLAADGWKQVALTNGTLFIKQDGSTEYKPALNSTAGDSFTYTVSDGTDESASATVSFSVTAVNDAPLAKANSYTATEDTLLTGKNIITDNDGTAGTDSDVETAAASLTIAKVNGTAWAGLTGGTDAGHLAADGWKQVSLTNGTLFIKQDGSTEYKAALNSTTGDSFTYTVTDGTDESASATVSFSVTAVNDAPLAKANSYTATEDTLLTGKNIITDNDATAGTDSDIETAAASLTIAKVNGTAWAGLTGGTDAGHLAADGWKQVALTNGTLFIKQDGSTEYKPSLNSTVGDSFTYTVSDGTDESASATVSFGVTAVNDVPLAKNNSYTATEDTLLSGKNIITDNDATAGTDSDVETAAASLTIAKVNGTAWAGLTGGTDAGHLAADGWKQVSLTNGTLFIKQDGSTEYKAALNSTTGDSFTYTVSDGTDESASATVSFSVTAVNDAPTSSDDSVTTTEDTAKLLALTDFGSYSDTENTAIASVKITTLESDGSLEYHNGTGWVAVTLNLEISAADITANKLRFVPDANENGSPYATIGFKVSDGTDYSAGAYTLTVNVTAVNDAPTSSDDSVTTLEDTAKVLALTDFGSYSDTENTAIASVKITTLESDGSLEYHNGTDWVAVTLNQEISAADITANKLRFVPDANENGSPYATIGFKVSDGTDYSAGAYTLTVNVTAVNDAPTSSDDSVTTLEDTAKVLALTDFGSYSDTENTAIASVKITTLESDGSLEYHNGTGWVAVTLNQEISAADIAANKLRFVPDANENGSPYATIGFKVSDGTDYSAGAYTLTVNVTTVNDAPTSSDDSVTTAEDTAKLLALTDFGSYSDTENTAIASVKITTLESDGSLEYHNGTGWVAVTLNQEISAADITANKLRFVPDSSENGSPYATIGFKVSDGTDYSAGAYTLTVNVTTVNDAPTSSDDSVTTTEDTAKLLALTDFGSYSDTENTAIASVKITTLESDGSLEYHNGTDWVAVTLNQEISAADIAANKLRFVPDSSENGSPYATIGFKVSDGTDYSAGAYTLTINVTAVNDVPLVKANTYTTSEDTLLTGKNIITDTDATAGTDSDVEAGSLSIAKVNGTAWAGLTGGTDADHLAANGWKQVSLTNGTLFIKQDGSIEYQPALNSNAGDSFTYGVSDGADDSASAATVTLNVTAVSDAAVIGGADAGSVTEDMNVTRGKLSYTGILTISDPDTGEAMFQTGSIAAGAEALGSNIGRLAISHPDTRSITASAGALGSLSITSDGVWTYTVTNADVQYLKAGQTKTETFTVKSADGTSHEVVITIIGINDAAVIGGGDTGSVTEDLNVTSGNLSSAGTLTISDSDTGEAVFQTNSVAAGVGTLGSLSITSAGTWTYTVPNDAVQYLTTGETKTETFTVMAGDGALHEVVITINGVSDAPSGSIVQLANLPPLLTATDTTQVSNEAASAYAPTESSDSNNSGVISAANGGTISDSSAKMFGSQSDSLHYELTLTGTIKNQLILENKEFSFRIPTGVFTHTNSSEILDFKATSPSGGPLPSWVHFDPNAKTFSGIPPVGSKAVTVLVIVRDTNGREVRTSFTIGVNKEDVIQGVSAGKTVNQPHKVQSLAEMAKRFNSIPGKPGLTEQVHAAGKLSRLQESRALLDSLKQL